MKKLISTLTALAMGCVFAVSAMAADEPARAMNMHVDMSHVYIEDATIEVGDTYTWSYDAAAGPVDYGEQGTALHNDYSLPNDQGGLTLVYTAVEPGTHTFQIVNRWWTESYKTVTVTVEEAAPTQEPEVPIDEPETPVEEPEVPADEGENPAAEGQTPVEQSTDSAVPASPVYEHGEIADAIANGTWGAEYTTCPACGYHNWTAGPSGYVCDTCGYITDSVKTGSGVRGYVDPAAGIKAAAVTATAPVTEADVAAAQAANDAYLAAIADLQAQVAQREAAYLAALQG